MVNTSQDNTQVALKLVDSHDSAYRTLRGARHTSSRFRAVSKQRRRLSRFRDRRSAPALPAAPALSLPLESLWRSCMSDCGRLMFRCRSRAYAPIRSGLLLCIWPGTTLKPSRAVLGKADACCMPMISVMHIPQGKDALCQLCYIPSELNNACL